MYRPKKDTQAGKKAKKNKRTGTSIQDTRVLKLDVSNTYFTNFVLVYQKRVSFLSTNLKKCCKKCTKS